MSLDLRTFEVTQRRRTNSGVILRVDMRVIGRATKHYLSDNKAEEYSKDHC